MDTLVKSPGELPCSLYEILGSAGFLVERYIASTPETRSICNDPFVLGSEYTNYLRIACEKVLRALLAKSKLAFHENQVTVLHILRGGLNFGLREALSRAFGWNRHSSAFISAQRARNSENPEDWHITENAYQKVYLAPEATIVFGDVVATGTSLEFALKQLLLIVEREGVSIRSVFFFTIGGIRSEEILLDVDQICRQRFPNYQGAAIIYFEGRFGVALPEDKLTVKITGTDLLRRDGLLAPEFIESQYENPAFPIERCTIYDAGSRAFWIPGYIEDLRDYWEKNLYLAEHGLTYEEILAERAPDIDVKRFSKPDLENISKARLSRCAEFLG